MIRTVRGHPLLQVRNGEGITPLHVAAQCGRAAVVAPLLQGGAAVDAASTVRPPPASCIMHHHVAHTASCYCEVRTRRMRHLMTRRESKP